MRKLLQAVAAAAAFLAIATPAHALTLGFNDDNLALNSGWWGNPVSEPRLNAGLAHGRQAGASTWRFMVVWSDVTTQSSAPVPATAAADPNWAGYKWGWVDRMVRSITANGMTPLPWVARAPGWAEGPGRPAVSKLVPAGTWKPSAPALENFARALATRYSGTYPDPERPGSALPRVTTFQGWNEPNLYTELTPQWTKTGSKYKISSVPLYRALLNGFYRGIKSAQPSATVLAAGSGPFGDFSPGQNRIQPVAFYRELLCASKGSGTVKIKKGCPKLSFDAWDHHTYPIGPPTKNSANADDVVVPGMPKLTRLMDAAAKAGVVKKKAAKNLWMTEMSWESAPDPSGLSLQEHARYMEGAFYILWKSGVKNILWWGSRDNAQGADWNGSFQSGVWARVDADPANDVQKPAFTAFRFPFTAYRKNGSAALWTKAPGSGPVVVQAESTPGVWKQVATLKRKGDVLTGSLLVGKGTNLRAVQGTDISLVWTT